MTFLLNFLILTVAGAAAFVLLYLAAFAIGAGLVAAGL